MTVRLGQYDDNAITRKKDRLELLLGMIIGFILVFGVGASASATSGVAVAAAMYVATLVAVVVAYMESSDGIKYALIYVMIGWGLGGVYAPIELQLCTIGGVFAFAFYVGVVVGTLYATFRAARQAALILATRPEGKLRSGLGLGILAALILSYSVLIGICWLGGWRPASTLRGETFPTAPAYPSPTPVPGLVGSRPLLQFATVTRVIDGETIQVSMGGNVYLVRYLGISTSSTDETCQRQAKAANAELVENRQVRLETDLNSPDADSQGRFLRYVYVGNVFVNAALIEKGYAVTSQPSTPLKHAADLATLEAQAKSAGVGCHAP